MTVSQWKQGDTQQYGEIADWHPLKREDELLIFVIYKITKQARKVEYH